MDPDSVVNFFRSLIIAAILLYVPYKVIGILYLGG